MSPSAVSLPPPLPHPSHTCRGACGHHSQRCRAGVSHGSLPGRCKRERELVRERLEVCHGREALLRELLLLERCELSREELCQGGGSLCSGCPLYRELHQCAIGELGDHHLLSRGLGGCEVLLSCNLCGDARSRSRRHFRTAEAVTAVSCTAVAIVTDLLVGIQRAVSAGCEGAVRAAGSIGSIGVACSFITLLTGIHLAVSAEDGDVAAV